MRLLASLHWPLLVWFVGGTALAAAGWNRLSRPRIGWGSWAVMVLLAVVPLLPAARRGYVYGPYDTNAAALPWADRSPSSYQPRGHRLNDVTLQFLPWRAEARRQLLRGRAPLLNPYSGAGHPLLGNAQSAPLSVVSLLTLPFEPLDAEVLRAMLVLMLALAGTFLAARQLGCGPPAALFAAVSYAYGGSLAVWRLFPHAEVIALFPWAFLAGERLLESARERAPRALLAAAVAGICAAGHPETALAAVLGLGARWLLALLPEQRAGTRRRLLAALVGWSLLGVLGTSLFVLPVAQSVLASEKLEREGGGDGDAQPSAAGVFGALANLAVPGVFGTPQRDGERGPGTLHWLVEGGVGLPALGIALAGLLGRRGVREESSLRLLAAACFAVHLAGGLVQWPRWLSVVGVVAPRYFAYVGGFAVALLAAATLERAGAEAGRRAWWRSPLAGLAGAVASMVAVLVATAALWRERSGAATWLPAESQAHLVIAGIAAAGAAAALVLARRSPLAGGLAVLATALQLGWALGGYYPTLPRALAYPSLPLTAKLAAEPGAFRIIGTRGVLNPNASTYYRLADVRAHDPMQPARYIRWLHESLDVDLMRHKRQYGRPRRAHLPFLRILGVRYLLSGPDLSLGPPWIDRGLFGRTRLWELSGEVRWALFPETVFPVADSVDARRRLREAGGPMRVATLELDPGGAAPAPNGRGRVARCVVDGDRLRIDVEVDADAWLVVSQAGLPGWRARGDGEPLRTAIADGALLAVQVPRGTRVVTLRYLPTAWIAGCALSAAAWLVGLLLLLRRRRPAPEAPPATEPA